MSEAKYFVKANKTQLYNLVKEKSPYSLPIMKETNFDFSSMFNLYTLEWVSNDGLLFEAYLSLFFGLGCLIIQRMSDGHEDSYVLDFDYLKENGYVKKKPSAIKSNSKV